MKEISKEEAKNLPNGTKYIVWNPLTQQYKEETATPIDIVHNKYCYDQLKFYLKDETNKIDQLY